MSVCHHLSQSPGFCVGEGWAKGKGKRQIIQVVPEAGLGPGSALLLTLWMGWGRKYFIGETNVGRVHKTLLHFLSCLPQWDDFLKPSLAPHIGVGGKVQELGRRLLQQPREKVSREALERDRGIFMVINLMLLGFIIRTNFFAS